MKTYGTIIDKDLVTYKDIDMVINRSGNTLMIICNKGTLVLSVDEIKKALNEDERPF